MVRVLQVYPQMNNAGTERVIFNLYENIDTTKIQFDFLVERSGEMDGKILSMGGKIHYLYKEKKKEYFDALCNFFIEHPEYKIVHTHTHARMDIVLKAARKCGVTCRIAHSHNARNDLPKAAAFIKGITSIPIEKNANCFFACSANAAKWLFPHKTDECEVLYNGINLDKYLYDRDTRNLVRDKLSISQNSFVMLHVGRFAKQKNHEYLVKILQAYNSEYHSDWKMLLVGEGPLEESIKQQVENVGLSDHVIFLGARKDVNELYSAADAFVFPSLHEGLGIVVIEAQASGMPCIVSDAVPPEADLEVGLLHTLKLQDDFKLWTDCIESTHKNQMDRDHTKTAILNSKYNIRNIAAQMQSFYLERGK